MERKQEGTILEKSEDSKQDYNIWNTAINRPVDLQNPIN